jgi:LytS/YehU family sensor histidine kinase
MNDAEVDILYIATPHNSHAALTIKGLQNNKHVLCEKPIALNYNDALQMNIEVNKKYEDYLLPSLSLQLLVENAVKHNQLSKTQPLLIDVFTTAGKKLIVNNNFQPRKVKGPSNRIGLDNIRSKYLLLEQKGFQVLEDGKTFSVVLPLIWNKVLDKKLVNNLNLLL